MAQTSTSTSNGLVRKFQFALIASAAALLVACGGGSGDSSSLVSAATGSTATSIPTLASATTVDAGVVTSEGSLRINNTEYNDAQANVLELTSNGTYKHFDGGLGLGMQVFGFCDGRFDGDGRAQLSTVVVDRAVRGPVTAVSATGFTVMGQTVTVNATASSGAVTVYGGNAAALADVAVGDWVSVYGTRDTTTSALAATRVDEEANPLASQAQLKGAISDVTATGFKIGGLTVTYAAADLYPANTTLAAGDSVTIWVNGAAVSNAVTAAKVVKYTPWSKSSTTGTATAAKANVQGLVSNLDATAKTFTVAGVTANYSALTTAPTTLVNGALANIQGTVNADGSIAVTYLRATATTAYPVTLDGNVTDFVSASSFKVRGLTVDATGITVTPINCVLANGIQAQVKGTVDAASGTVKATAVKCPGVQPPNTTRTVTLSGPVTAVNATAKTFTVTTSSGAVTVSWNAKTRFIQGVTAANLGTATTALQMDVARSTDATGAVSSTVARLIGTDLSTYYRR